MGLQDVVSHGDDGSGKTQERKGENIIKIKPDTSKMRQQVFLVHFSESKSDQQTVSQHGHDLACSALTGEGSTNKGPMGESAASPHVGSASRIGGAAQAKPRKGACFALEACRLSNAQKQLAYF
jgi:hypothetical protein